MDNRNDQIRHDILVYLNDVRKKAKNEHMAKETHSQIKRGLRDKGYTDEEVSGEIMYLYNKGQIKKEVKVSYSRGLYSHASRKAEKIKLETVQYYISDTGRDYLEGSSKFQKNYDFSRTVINNYAGAVAVGVYPQAIVFEPHLEIYSALDILQKSVSQSPDLDEKNKAEYALDIETIKKQISKEKPNKNVIKEVWGGLQGIATLSGLHDLYEKASQLLGPFLS